MYTTLNQIRKCSPCEPGWKKLLAHLSKTKADDEPLSIIAILDSIGLDDALWCLQAVKGYAREKQLYAVRCARAVQHLMTDQRSIDALNVAERFATGEATEQEMAAAAGAAAWDAAGAARAAAWAAAWEAAWEAARAAARSAAGYAERVAARDAQEKDLREMCEVTA